MTETTVKQAQVIRRNHSYIHFSAADRLGNALATLEENLGRPWAEVEPEARRRWEEAHDRPWSEFREVVRQGWAEVRSQFSDEAGPTENPDSYRTIFHHHYQTNYLGGPYDFAQYAPAYHYGYDLAVDGRLSQASWAEIEPKAGQHWQSRSYAGPWEDFKAAVHYAWSETRKKHGDSRS